MAEEDDGLGPSFEEMGEFVGKPFRGRIRKVEWQQGKAFEGKEPVKQLHVEIEPLDFKVKGKTGVMHEYYRFSMQRNSKWGALRRAIEDAFGNVQSIKELEGKVSMWGQTDVLPGGQRSVNPKTKEPAPFRIPMPDIGLAEEAEDLWAGFDEKLKSGLTKEQIAMVGKKMGYALSDVDRHMNELVKSGTVVKKGDEFWLKR